MSKRPELVFVRETRPQCGAVTGEEAEMKCAPIVHCPASGLTDDDGFLVQITEESAKAVDAWQKSGKS